MADCTGIIAANIVSDCSTIGVGGNEIKAWIGYRPYATVTYDVTNPSKVTAIAFASTKRIWTFTGVKKILDSGHDIVIADDRPNKWKHSINFQGFSFKAADIENLDNLNDVFVVVESKDKFVDGDGTFRIYGMKSGLFIQTATMRANNVNGARVVTLESLPGQEEPYSNYTFDAGTYAQTLAALVAMETPAI